jgi:hypothetical protein
MRPSLRLALFLAMLLTGCHGPDAVTVFAEPGDTGLLCGLGIDGNSSKSGDLELGLDQARRSGTIVQLYGHSPDGTVPVARIEALLAAAAERGMDFVTYRDMVERTAAGRSLALSFDDDFVDGWHALRPLFDRYGARATFFVSRFQRLGPEQRAKLHELADDGHAIEYHGTDHQPAERYVAEHGIAAYLADEIEPGLDAMRDDGFAPVAFAYPHGERTAETDVALLERFPIVRGIMSRCE